MDTFDLEHVEVILWSFSALFSKLGRSSKRAHRRAKWTKLWASCLYVVCMWVLLMHVGTFYLEHVKVILRSFGALFSKFGHNSKTPHHKSETDKNLGVRHVYALHMRTFDLERVKVIFGSFGALFSNLDRNT